MKYESLFTKFNNYISVTESDGKGSLHPRASMAYQIMFFGGAVAVIQELYRAESEDNAEEVFKKIEKELELFYEQCKSQGYKPPH